jgi:hypothetical protein
MRDIGRKSSYCGARLAGLAVLGLVVVGCSGRQSPQQALDAQLKAANITKADLASFAGKVTIDGQTPEYKRAQPLVVMLWDKSHPDKNTPPINSVCQKDGSFEFSRYVKGDGVPPGSYVVLFGQFTSKGKMGLGQPDGLNNLYDDPDKNSQNKDLVLELAAPGKTNFLFNLEIAGKEPETTPGPHAVTKIGKGK